MLAALKKINLNKLISRKYKLQMPKSFLWFKISGEFKGFIYYLEMVFRRFKNC